MGNRWLKAVDEMIPEKDELIFDILKAGLTGRSVFLPEALEWKEAGRELAAQTVVALPADFICSHPKTPQAVKAHWEKIIYAHMARWTQILYAQEEVIQIMERNQIPMIIMKGTAAAMYYPTPQYRSMGDVDFLVWKKDYQRALTVMLENGYVLTESEDSRDYHYTLEKNGLLFELHRSLAKVADDGQGKVLMRYIREGLAHREWQRLDGYLVPVLPPVQNGLVLLYHIRQHLREGLGLRQIIDWMMYAARELDDEHYVHFQEVIKETGLEPLAVCVTRMCQIYLGLREEDITWCLTADHKLCGELMEYIMEQGNFGQKTGIAGKGMKALNRHKDCAHMMKWMQRQGRKHWKMVEKHPFMGHFAAVHELFWYISYILHRKHPVRSLRVDIRTSRQRRRMFKQLSS